MAIYGPSPSESIPAIHIIHAAITAPDALNPGARKRTTLITINAAHRPSFRPM